MTDASPNATTMFQHLDTTLAPDGVRTITLNRPDRLNAVNPQLALEFPRAMQDAAADDATRVVVITGAGRGFCAGLDLADPAGVVTAGRHASLDPYYWVGHWVHAVVACEKPVIAAVNGAAAGAGFGLALACDIRIIAANATCTAGYVRRGLSPDAGVTWFLPRLIGHARAMEIVLSGRDIDSAEALRIGLATMIPDATEFHGAVAQYASLLASGPPIAMALTKRLMLASSESSLDTQLRAELTHIKTTFASADVREAMTAFKEKRRPVFRGE